MFQKEHLVFEGHVVMTLSLFMLQWEIEAAPHFAEHFKKKLLRGLYWYLNTPIGNNQWYCFMSVVMFIEAQYLTELH
jgi:hypothetical protein